MKKKFLITGENDDQIIATYELPSGQTLAEEISEIIVKKSCVFVELIEQDKQPFYGTDEQTNQYVTGTISKGFAVFNKITRYAISA